MNVWLVRQLADEDVESILDQYEDDIIELAEEADNRELGVADVEELIYELINQGEVRQDEQNEDAFEITRIILEEAGCAFDFVVIDNECCDAECCCDYDIMKLVDFD